MQTQQWLAEYEISTDTHRPGTWRSFSQFLAEDSYWSPGIPRSVVERAIENSLLWCVPSRCASWVCSCRHGQVNAPALLADLFILKAHRGKGLSKWLMHRVVGHEDGKV